MKELIDVVWESSNSKFVLAKGIHVTDGLVESMSVNTAH